jgi:hypothetical protein
VALSVIFPKWINVLPTLAAVGGLLGATSVVGGFWYYATPKYFKVGYMPKQPGAGFNHQLHAGQLGMDCRYCHTKVEQSAEANIPNVATCYGCHADQRLAKLAVDEGHKAKTQFVRDAYAKDEPIEWRRVHKVPDYVRNFPHNVHVNAGVSCYSCHGQITGMPVVYQVQPLSMSWCLDCHRDPTPHLVPKTMVTKLQWVENELRQRAEKGDRNETSPEAKRLLESIHSMPPANCGACHY